MTPGGGGAGETLRLLLRLAEECGLAALVFGGSAAEVEAEGTPAWLVPHRVLEGSRPTTASLADKATASLRVTTVLPPRSCGTPGNRGAGA